MGQILIALKSALHFRKMCDCFTPHSHISVHRKAEELTLKKGKPHS